MSDNPTPSVAGQPSTPVAREPAGSSAPLRAAAPAGPGAVLLSLATLGWLLAVGFAGGTAYFSLRYLDQKAEAARQWEEAELAKLEVRSLKNRLEAVQIIDDRRTSDLQKASDVAAVRLARLGAPKARKRELSALAVWNPDNKEGVLLVDRFPATEPTEDYQVWVADPQKPEPISAGIFGVGEDGSARVILRVEDPLPAATQFTIRRTRKGGSAKPDGVIIATGSF